MSKQKKPTRENSTREIDVIKPLVDLVREEALDSEWSRGVELARRGAASLVEKSEDEWTFLVKVGGRVTSPTVRLWPTDQEWKCDSGVAEDPSMFVVAAVLTAKRIAALEKADKDGKKICVADDPGRIAYRFTSDNRGLSINRVFIRKKKEDGDFTGSLLSRRAGLEQKGIAATKQDIEAEIALQQQIRGGWLSAPKVRRVLGALVGCKDVKLDGKKIDIGEEIVPLRAVVRDHKDGFQLQLEPNPTIDHVFPNGALRCGKHLRAVGPIKLSKEEQTALAKGRFFSTVQAGDLVGEVIPGLQKIMSVEILTERLPRAKQEKPRLALEVDSKGDQLTVLPIIVYGKPVKAKVISGHQMTLVNKRGAIPLRDHDEEQRLARQIKIKLGLQLGHRTMYNGYNAIEFAESLRKLPKVDILGDAHEKFFIAGELSPELDIRGEGFSLSFRSLEKMVDQSIGAVDGQTVIKAWRQGLSLVPLTEGGFAPLPSEWLESYGHRLAGLMESKSEEEEGLPPSAQLELLRLCDELDYPPPPELERLRAIVDSFDSIPTAGLPEDLTAELRDYQQDGVNWLCFLRDARLGGLLADDMGLGKTLQAICAIQSGTLVVAPASVMKNWEEEIKKFRPSLSVDVYHGPRRKINRETDVILTTYAILRLDIEKLEKENWKIVILDESQSVKNPESQVAQAAFRMRSSWKLSMTGTPIENRLEELWSQFHFMNPGLLSGRQDFCSRYVTPITNGDSKKMKELRKRIKPFILRRLKKEVAKELPPRTEVVLRCQLGDEERGVYDSIMASTRKEVVSQLKMGKGVMAALEALLRLRQASCHSALIPGIDAEHSSKLELLYSTLEQALAEGHKALIFSQWTSLLNYTGEGLTKRNIDFLRLDGSSRDRQGLVKKFQKEDGPPVMLISLKAGGVGLTLTQADHVFILDPWWNPAAEDQAADRAHRIGQKNPVLIHRLVAMDTVEEKILELQQKKRELTDMALSDTAKATSITRDDLLSLLQ